MLRGIAIGASTVLGLALITSSAHAQAQTSGTRFGVEAAFGSNNNVGIGAGAFVKFHLAEISERAITGRVNFDYFFPSSSKFGGFTTHYWEAEGSGLLDIVAKGTTKPYVGAGLTYSRWSYSYTNAYCPGCAGSASNTNLHLLGGINFMNNSKLMPFVEAKIELGNGSELIFKGGVHF
jgi:hypothetical protein